MTLLQFSPALPQRIRTSDILEEMCRSEDSLDRHEKFRFAWL